MSATKDIDLLGTILIEGRGNGKAQTCNGKSFFVCKHSSSRPAAGHGGVARSLVDVPLPPPVITTTRPFAEKRSVGLMGAATSMVIDLVQIGWQKFESLDDGSFYGNKVRVGGLLCRIQATRLRHGRDVDGGRWTEKRGIRNQRVSYVHGQVLSSVERLVNPWLL